MGFFDRINAKIELFKLEQRYTKRKRRTTFISDAVYIDGDYIYGADSPKMMSPTSPKTPQWRVMDFSHHSGRRN